MPFRPGDQIHAVPRTWRISTRQETNAAVTVDGRLIGTETSGGGVHAEIHVLKSGLWANALAQARIAAQTRGSSELAILTNRSPCHSICTPKLIEALEKVRSSSPGVRFVLAPTGVYEPTVELTEQGIRDYADSLAKDIRVPLKRAYLLEEPENPNKGGITTMNDIYRLQAAGWQLQQLLARPVSTSAGNQWLMGIEQAAKHALAQKVGTDNSKVS